MTDRKRIVSVLASLIIGVNLLAGIMTDDLLFGFSAIAFAIIFHAMATE